MNRTSSRLIVTLLLLLAPLVLTVHHLVYGGRVPDPLPTHWSGSAVDGTTAAGAFFVVLLVIGVLLTAVAIAVLWFGRPGPSGRMAVCGLMFGSWLLAAMYAGIVVVAADVAQAADVDLPWYAVVATVGIPVVAAAAAWALLPAPWPRSEPNTDASPIVLGAEERVVWIGRASSAPLRWIGAVGVLAAGVAALFAVLIAAIVFCCSIALVSISQLSVRIDATGLHTTWGLFGRPRSTVPLERITGAQVEEIRPMQWGGWGLRITPRGKAAIVRAGEAIMVDRSNGPRYLVTVDDAQQGVDVLAALVDRARRRADPGSAGPRGR